MPTYDYICSKCEHKFDKICKIDNRHDSEKEPCPNCGGKSCVLISLSAPSLLSPFRVDGLVKPQGDFRERVQQIKKTSGRKNTIKDY